MNRAKAAQIGGLSAWHQDRDGMLEVVKKGGDAAMKKYGRSYYIRLAQALKDNPCEGSGQRVLRSAADVRQRAACPVCGRQVKARRLVISRHLSPKECAKLRRRVHLVKEAVNASN